LGKSLIVFCFLTVAGPTLNGQSTYRPTIPRTWDEKALSDWATPLAGINIRPTHISEAEYYALPVDDSRTYPVYARGREPQGYWEMLQSVGPKPMLETNTLRSSRDWLEAGGRVFNEIDHIHLRTFDPALIEIAKKGESKLIAKDGSIPGMRWVPTAGGVALSFSNCRGCHLMRMADGTEIPGASSLASPVRPLTAGLIPVVQTQLRYVAGAAPIQMGDEPLGMWLYRAYGVPWRPDDEHVRLKDATVAEYRAFLVAHSRGGAVPRWNGSLFYPAKVPDLIGIKDRKYIDHTATHLNRGIGDLMRYAAMVSFGETTQFGQHNMLGGGAQRPRARRSDEVLYALALYLQSLKPPPNPNPVNEQSAAGEKLFNRAGCVGCHVPPLYTNNKVTLALDFEPPKEAPPTMDILRVTVGTDPGLALKTRKGTGYYKVPSLKGLWYRGHYLHDGSAASLEEMFDPARLSDEYKPKGYVPPGVTTRAIKGHEFGLKLTAPERAQLIAFLRTL
jgi:hypothetical protein